MIIISLIYLKNLYLKIYKFLWLYDLKQIYQKSKIMIKKQDLKSLV